jgi:hypothetical protein
MSEEKNRINYIPNSNSFFFAYFINNNNKCNNIFKINFILLKKKIL